MGPGKRFASRLDERIWTITLALVVACTREAPIIGERDQSEAIQAEERADGAVRWTTPVERRRA